jgi:mRNA interferase RelE/StbE
MEFVRACASREAMSAALQICYTPFDSAFFKLPANVRSRIEAKIDEMGLRLKTFPHHRLKGGHNRYRLRVGDYRIIYTFDAERNVIHLLGVGNRKEIYRDL